VDGRVMIMSTTPDPSVSKKGKKKETSLRRSLRVAGLPPESAVQDAGTSGSDRPIPEVPAPSAADSSTTRLEEAVTSGEPEAPPASNDDAAAMTDSPEKKADPESRGEPSVRESEEKEESVSVVREPPVVTQSPTAGTGSMAAVGVSRVASVYPEPTAVIHHSSQVEGGTLALPEERGLQMRTSSASGTGTTPVHFGFAAGITPPSLIGGAWSSTLWPEQRAIQRLQGVPESPGSEIVLA
jgi:hypothetical protein